MSVEQAAGIVEAAWCAAWSALGYDGVTTVEAQPELLRVLTPTSADLLLNAVLRFQQASPVTAEDVQRIMRPFRLAHRPLQWWVQVERAPPGLRDQLHQAGMVRWDAPPGMVLPLPGWTVPARMSAITVRPVRTDEAAIEALGIICDVFGATPPAMARWSVANPAFTVYLAHVRGAPAGALACHLDRGVAGFFHVATLPQWRRQGVAWNLMAQALEDMRQAGAQVAALTASSAARDLYRALGFSDCGQFELYMPGLRLMEALADG